jgi:glycosyltransferase involved in cell wall biosynthesis
MQGGSRPFLLSLGRLVEYKRVDLAIQGAQHIGMRLVVAGDGPERARLERMAGPDVEFLGQVSEEQAGDLLESCEALVFPGEEDFGISLVEANAHGRPVVCFGRGGATETMVDGETAIFFATQAVSSVAQAIERCVTTRWSTDRLQVNAQRFSEDRFVMQFGDAVAAAVKAPGRA